MSPDRPAGMFVIITLEEPMATMPGPAGTQLGSMHGVEMLPTMAAASELIITVGAVAETMVSGRAGWATGVGVGAGGWMGA